MWVPSHSSVALRSTTSSTTTNTQDPQRLRDSEPLQSLHCTSLLHELTARAAGLESWSLTRVVPNSDISKLKRFSRLRKLSNLVCFFKVSTDDAVFRGRWICLKSSGFNTWGLWWFSADLTVLDRWSAARLKRCANSRTSSTGCNRTRLGFLNMHHGCMYSD